MCVHLEYGVFGVGPRVCGASTFQGLQPEGCVFRAQSSWEILQRLLRYPLIAP